MDIFALTKFKILFEDNEVRDYVCLMPRYEETKIIVTEEENVSKEYIQFVDEENHSEIKKYLLDLCDRNVVYEFPIEMMNRNYVADIEHNYYLIDFINESNYPKKNRD
jgi:hypothetical protein